MIVWTHLDHAQSSMTRAHDACDVSSMKSEPRQFSSVQLRRSERAFRRTQ